MSFIDSTLEQFAWNVPLIFLFGSGLAWTFIEYYFHRFDLHTEVNLDESKKADPDQLVNIFSRHVHHHVFMNQRLRIVLDSKSYAKYLGGGWIVTYFFMSDATRYLVIAAVALGSLIYDWMHLAFHFEDVMPKFLRNTSWF